MKEINGNLIKIAKTGRFDVITHGCNCFCRMGRGIAPQIKEAFPEAWEADKATITGDFRKLGNFSFGGYSCDNGTNLVVVNSYTQFSFDAATKPLDYEALTLCMRKINHEFSGSSIGIPLIGAGLAGGDWNIIKAIIITELKDMDVTIVHYYDDQN